jgi:DNA-binding response OmpR family regulator
MPENRLLILCLNEDMCREMESYFIESGYTVDICADYDKAVDILRDGKYKPGLMIYLMDTPGRKEYETVDVIRGITGLPIIMLSKDDRLETQLYAFSKKIDDYMIIPVPLPLLEAHVEAVLRRCIEKKRSVIIAGALTIDYESRKIYLEDQILKVTAKEFDLMEFFVQHRGMILSRDRILDAVWGFDYVGGYRSVDTLVKKLRAKLTPKYPYIQTVYGVGYCFDV